MIDFYPGLDTSDNCIGCFVKRRIDMGRFLNLINSLLGFNMNSIINMHNQNKREMYDKREPYYRACRIIIYGCRYGGNGEQVKDDLKKQGLEFICDDSNGAKFLFDEETASFIADVFYNWKKYSGSVGSFKDYGDNNATKDLYDDYMKDYKDAAEFFKMAKEQLPNKFEKYLKMIRGCAPMSKSFNHLKNHKIKYIIGLLLIVVLSMSLYIFGNQDNKIEKLSKSVLMLNIYDTKDELFATGSGFVAFENDVLVTNYHVIDKAYKIEAVDENDVVYSLDKVIAFDKEKDLAILKFSTPTDLKVLKLHNSSKVSKGDEVIAIGSPLGLKNTVSKGIVSSIREDKETSIIQITAPISSGSSGGALLTENGKVIGVTFAGIEEGQNLNLAIPSNEVTDLYKNKVAEQSVQDFFFEQYPDEKYKLGCIEASIADLKSGKYDGKDVCVSGWVPRLMDTEDSNDNSIFITSDKNKINYYAGSRIDNEFNRMVLSLEFGRKNIPHKGNYNGEMKEKYKDVIWIYWGKTDRAYDIKAGEYVTVYGKAYGDIINDPIIEIN